MYEKKAIAQRQVEGLNMLYGHLMCFQQFVAFENLWKQDCSKQFPQKSNIMGVELTPAWCAEKFICRIICKMN